MCLEAANLSRLSTGSTFYVQTLLLREIRRLSDTTFEQINICRKQYKNCDGCCAKDEKKRTYVVVSEN
jgi:hypothetical protein